MSSYFLLSMPDSSVKILPVLIHLHAFNPPRSPQVILKICYYNTPILQIGKVGTETLKSGLALKQILEIVTSRPYIKQALLWDPVEPVSDPLTPDLTNEKEAKFNDPVGP